MKYVLSVSAALAAGAAVSAVSAESLAQPRDTSLERQAAAYIAFREDVAVIESTPFTSAETTREAHRRFSAHDADALSSGWVAYAALVAADTPEFADAIAAAIEPAKKKRKKGQLEGRDAFLSNLAQDPQYLRSLPGADKAMDRVLAMTLQDASRFNTLGEAFKTQAYAMQKTNWGKAKIGTSSSRLSDAEQFARSRPAPSAPSIGASGNGGVTTPALASLNGAWSTDWGQQKSQAKGGDEPNAEAVMDRVLNLAARYSIGNLNGKVVGVYAKNDRSSQCLSMAALTLKQCIAATRTPYEEAFCIGEHALNDTAECVGWIAGVEMAS